jgi:hypothetical protein
VTDLKPTHGARPPGEMVARQLIGLEHAAGLRRTL